MRNLKRLMIVVGAVCVLVGGIGCLSRHKEATSPTQPILLTGIPMTAAETAQIPARQAELKMATDSIVAIAQKLNDPEVNQLVDFFRNNERLVLPEKVGFRIIGEQRPQAFFLACLVPADANLSDEWAKRVAGDTAVASFQPDVSCMVLRDQNNMTSIWNGIFILHEIHHAHDWVTEPYDWRDTKTFCYKEKNVHEFQNRVMSALGGKAYNDMINDDSKKLKDALDANGMKIGPTIPHSHGYDTRLDAIFGPVKSPYEKDARMTPVWVNCLFELVDRYAVGMSPEQKEDTKARWLKTIYLNRGILPEAKAGS